MNNYKIKIFLGGIFLFGALSAGTIRSQGQAGATQLLIPVGASVIALSEANGATVSGVDALYLNPAGVAGMKGGFQGSVSTMSYIADIDISYVALVANFGKSGFFGVSIKSMDFGDIPVTTAQNTEGTGENFSPNFQILTATYAKVFADRVRFGTSLKFVSEQIINTSANGLAIDMGVQYQFATLPLSLGVTLSNLGERMEYTGSDLEQSLAPEGSGSGSSVERFRIKSEAFDLPVRLNVAVNYAPIPGLNLMYAFSNNAFAVNSNSFAAKYTMGPAWVAGGLSSHSVADTQPSDIQDFIWDEAKGEAEDGLFGTTFGAGVTVPVGGVNLGISYSVRSVDRYFDSNNIMQLTVLF